MIKLEAVNKDNWQTCMNLPTSEAHRFVAPNLYSIAEAQFYPRATAYCIVLENIIIGLTMFGLDENNDDVLWIDRLMIAEPYRGNGYGTAVLEIILKQAIAMQITVVQSSTEPENAAMKHVFTKAGFLPLGRQEDGEDIYQYRHPSLD